MNKNIELAAIARDKEGTGDARLLRRNKMVPAIIYGKNKQNVKCAVDAKEFAKISRSSGFWVTPINLNIAGKVHPAIPCDIQLHPVTDEIVHVDFMHLGADVKIKVHVSLNFINQDKCIDIKRGGVLSIMRRNIDIQCDANNILHHVDVDISALKLGHSLHVSDLVLPSGIKLITNPKEVVAVLSGSTSSTEEEEKA